jgi:L-2-hydroxyglutarate oxidase
MLEIGASLNEKSQVLLGYNVEAIHEVDGGKQIITSKGIFNSKYLIVCGGLQADRLAKFDGVKLKEKVVGFRGDYYELEDHAKYKVKNLIYPVPDPDFPFLGVHFTRMVNGDVECGPNAVFSFKREGYNKTDFNLKDSIDALTYSGTWNLFFKNIKFGVDEYRRAFSKKLFLKTLQKLIPSLEMSDIRPGRAGVRALLLGQDGDTRDDFRIEYTSNSIHVLNAPSPAATAALAIGDDIKEMAVEKFDLG